MSEDTTKPTTVVGLSQYPEASPWQQDDDVWSFGPERRLLFTGVTRTGNSRPRPSPSRNIDDNSTNTPERSKIPRKTPQVKPRNFGRRSSTAISHWEGVVESVDQSCFEARLIPFKDGVPIAALWEMADFDFDELVDESDAKLIREGAVFYWTIARSRNAAGTVMNSSIVRFKRSPGPTNRRQVAAAEEAERLLEILKDDN